MKEPKTEAQRSMAFGAIKNRMPGRDKMIELHRIALSQCMEHVEYEDGCFACQDGQTLFEMTMKLTEMRQIARGGKLESATKRQMG